MSETERVTVRDGLDAFERYVATSTRSVGGRTPKVYASYLGIFLEYLATKDTKANDSLTSLTVEHAIDFILWLKSGGHYGPAGPSQGTLAMHLTVTYRFYVFLWTEGLVQFDGAAMSRLRERYQRFRGRRARRLPDDNLNELVERVVATARAVPPAPEDKPRQELIRLRDIALVETLRATGMRIGELVGLTRGALNPERRSAKVVGKGIKERIVLFDRRAWDAVQTYVRKRDEGTGETAVHRRPVFARHDRRAGQKVLPLTVRSAERIVAKLAGQAGLGDRQITPHLFRHAFATDFYRGTSDVILVQKALGHESPATTEIYTKVVDHEVEDAYREVFD